jgi:hypothetical protein
MSQAQALCVAVCVVSIWNPMHALTHFIVGDKHAIQGRLKPSMSHKAMPDEKAIWLTSTQKIQLFLQSRLWREEFWHRGTGNQYMLLVQ